METKEHYIGIDYGMGKTNRDENFHYGVIHQGEVLQAWADSSEGIYPEPEPCAACNGTGNQLDENFDPTDEPCEDCNGEGTIDSDYTEAIGFTYSSEGYECSQSSDDSDIFLTKSPYFTTCQYCSPCAPGAGYIMNTVIGGIKTYCFGHDWFDDNKAPYPVFDCKTGLPVEP